METRDISQEGLIVSAGLQAQQRSLCLGMFSGLTDERRLLLGKLKGEGSAFHRPPIITSITSRRLRNDFRGIDSWKHMIPTFPLCPVDTPFHFKWFTYSIKWNDRNLDPEENNPATGYRPSDVTLYNKVQFVNISKYSTQHLKWIQN